MTLKNNGRLLKSTLTYWSEDQVSRLAASLAYYTIFSLAPFLIICIALAGLVFGNDLAQQHILDQVSSMMGADSANQIKSMIQSASKPSTSIINSLIGIIILLFGAAGFFGELHGGLNTIWGVKIKPGQGILGYIQDRFLSLSMVFGVAFLLLVSLIISAFISALGNYLNQMIPGFNILWWLVNIIISLCIYTLLFAMILKILPDVLIRWKNVWLASFITGALFTIGKFLLEFYLNKVNIASAYGAAGSLIVILVWVYYSAQILFFGAEFSKVMTLKNEKKIKPNKNAMLISKVCK